MSWSGLPLCPALPEGTEDPVQEDFALQDRREPKSSSLLSFAGFVQDVSWQCKLRGGRSFCLHLGLLQFNFHLGYPHHTVLYQSGVLVAVLCCAVGLPVRSGWPLVRYVITCTHFSVSSSCPRYQVSVRHKHFPSD